MGEAAAQTDGSGLLERLRASAVVSVDRLPVLKLALARAATSAGELWQRAGATDARIAMDYAESGRADDLLRLHESCICATVFAEAWDCRLLIGADRAALAALTEAIFGADGNELPESETRPVTAVDLEVAKWAHGVMATALAAAFSGLAGTAMTLESVAETPDADVLGRRGAPAIVARYRMTVHGAAGRLFVALPQSAMLPFKSRLEKLPEPEAPPVDPVWEARFKSQIRQAGVEVRAILGSRTLTLGDIASLKPGQVLELDRSVKGRIRVECREQPLFWCEMGQADGVYTLRVQDFVDHEQEFMDDILHH